MTNPGLEQARKEALAAAAMDREAVAGAIPA